MPKIIPNLSASILSECRKILLDPEKTDFAIRDVSTACGVAVGTVYNYYPSKEFLIAEVMLADWRAMLEDVENTLPQVDSVEAGIALIYEGLSSYARLYRLVWQKNIVSPGTYDQLNVRHGKLLTNVTGMLTGLTERFHQQVDELSLTMVTVILLERSQLVIPFDEIIPALRKLLA